MTIMKQMERDLKKYYKNIDDGFVEIINKREDHNINRHITGLTEHYMKYNGIYDWLIYLDFDGLLYIKDNKTLREFLSQQKFNNCQFDKNILGNPWR